MSFRRASLISVISLIVFLFVGNVNSPLYNGFLAFALLALGVIGPWLWLVAVGFGKLADGGYRVSKSRQARVKALREEHRYPADPVQFYLRMHNQGVSVFDMAKTGNQEDLSMYIAGYLMHAQGYTQEEAFRLVGRDQGMVALLALAEELGLGEEPAAQGRLSF